MFRTWSKKNSTVKIRKKLVYLYEPNRGIVIGLQTYHC